jgi:rhodanese-related sulfurtransferase
MNKSLYLLLLVLFLGLSNTCTAADYRNRPLTAELVNSGITIVDIRTEPEWRETGVVPGSVLMTFFRSNRSYDLEGFIIDLGRHIESADDVALLCRRGNRSAKLAALLSERGFTSIINITGGISRAAGNGVQLVPYPAAP